jgi:hypothetical protein
MRTEPTRAEEASIAALVDAFVKDGHAAAVIPREVNDKPDALLDVGGVRVNCECIQIPPQYIYHHHHKHFPAEAWAGMEILSILWPNEPHQWIAEAIRKKAKLCASYQQATGAKESWLLIHAPAEPTQFFVDGSQYWIQWSLRHGAKTVDHPFGQIFLWTPQGGIQPISVRRDEYGTHSELGINFASGYPTLCVNRYSVPFKTLPRGALDPQVWEVWRSDFNRLVVDPIDVEYRRHAPSHRSVRYLTRGTVWSDRAEIVTTAVFADEQAPTVLWTKKLEGLLPSKDYWIHALHEFRSPKQLHTWHVVQPF